MARTPLFRRIARAMRLAGAMERDGVPTAEALDRRAEIDLSRRRLLQGAGVAALAGASTRLAGCAPVDDDVSSVTQEARRDARVVVIGAGLGGLTAAYKLTRAGFAPRVYDANDRVGGRAFSLRGYFDTKAELGGELIDTGHTNIQMLATELGLTVLNQAAAVSSYEPERYVVGGQRYTEAQIVEAFRPVAQVLRRDFRSQGESRYATYDRFTPESRALDRLSIADWFDRAGVSGPLRALLDVAYTAEYGLECSEQSYLNLLYLISRDADRFALFGESDELFTIREGNDALATRMAATLDAPVQLGHALTAVRTRADGTLRVVLRAGGRTVETIADKVVLAIPFNQLRRCDLDLDLPAAKRRSLQNLAYGTNAKVMIGTRSRPWYAQGSTGTSFHDRVFHESWESSRAYPGPTGVMTSFTGGRFGLDVGGGTSAHQGQRFADALDGVFPGARAAYDGRVARMHWPTARFFEGSYGCYRPGDYTSFVGSEAEAVGNVHFAGEHTSTEAQGFLEGAVESGIRAAREIKQTARV